MRVEIKFSCTIWCQHKSATALLVYVLIGVLVVIAPVEALASPLAVEKLRLTDFRVYHENYAVYATGFSQVDSSLSDSSAGDGSPLSKSGGWTSSPKKSRPIQNPTTALFKSLAVPGWGQIGNKSYVKAGFVIGLESFLFLKWLRFRQKTADARQEFEKAPDTEPNKTFFFNKFQATRNDRNLFAWLTGTVIFVSMFDAFVDAHLSGFPKARVTGDRDGRLSLAPFPGSVDEQTVWGAQIKYSF